MVLPLKNGSFLVKFSSLQNLKVTIYKGFKISKRPKYPKNRVLKIANFSKIEMQKKALSVHFKNIPEGVIFLSFNIAKTLINKDFYVIPAQAEIHFPLLSSLRRRGKQSLLTSRTGVPRLSFYKKLEKVTELLS